MATCLIDWRKLMDSITFEIDDIIIKLVNGTVLFWKERSDHEPDIVLDIKRLNNALSTAHMLIKNED
jgi:hypothetical protein